ncbi:MAG TPA: phenylalanine 4-monooxygenase [Acidimicrobiia bacterium]|jgi:phenylalanine-4-hydroxylase
MAQTSVELPPEHPGFVDGEYRRRRDEIAGASAGFEPGHGAAPPEIRYTDAEAALWRKVSSALAGRHQRYACAEYLRATAALALPADQVPSLATTSRRLRELSGFRLEAVPGLVPTRTFYGALAERYFLSTQYLRHESAPFYTPEPDIIHELVGHACMLASPLFADLYAAAGRASLRAHTPEALERFSKLFWFTIEFGVVEEHDEICAYGAGLLSSYGELEVFRNAEVRAWSVDEMETRDYDITHFQPVLYCAGTVEQTARLLHDYFDAFGQS